MPQVNDIAESHAIGNSESGQTSKVISYRNLLRRTQRSREASITAILVDRYGEEGRLPEEELVCRYRKYREKAEALRNEASTSESDLDETIGTVLRQKAARLETYATRYPEILNKRVEPLLSQAAARLYPKGHPAYREMREDFLQEAAIRLYRVLGSGANTFFEENFLHALVTLIFTAARQIGRIYGRGEGGRRPLPEELDAPVHSSVETEDSATTTLADTLVASKTCDPEAQASLRSIARQLRGAVVATLTQQGPLAERKFDVICLRIAQFKPAEVREMIVVRYQLKAYSPESERLDNRLGMEALSKALRQMTGALDGVSAHDIIEALQDEGHSIASKQ